MPIFVVCFGVGISIELVFAMIRGHEVNEGFLVTGLLGFGLGPLLNMYLSTPNGGQMVMNALGITGGVFVGLSAYVLVSKRDFSFMGGFLTVGILAAAAVGRPPGSGAPGVRCVFSRTRHGVLPC